MQGSLEKTAVISEQFALCAWFLLVFWSGFCIFIVWDFLKFLSFYINHCKNLVKFDFCSIFCLLKIFFIIFVCVGVPCTGHRTM